MKKIFTVSIITLLFGYLNYFDNEESTFSINSNDKNLSSIDESVTDSFEVRNIYALGQVPFDFGFPDTIGVQFLKKLAGPRVIKLRTVIHNDSANGPIKEIGETFISNTNSYDTIIKVYVNGSGMEKTDFVVVEALPGDVGIVLMDDTTNNVLSECYNNTSGIFNHSNPCLPSNIQTGFSGATGKLVAAFRNKGPTPYYIHQIEYKIFSSTNAGIRPFKLVIYADNGSGKPGSLIYSSSTLFPPNGPNVPTSVIYNLDSALGISSNNRFYAGYRQNSTNNINACSQSETLVRPKSFFFTTSDTSNTWYDFRDSSKNIVPDISVIGYTGVLNLNEIVEAMYPQTNDSLKVYLYSVLSPRFIIDSAKTYHSAGTAKVYFSNAVNGNPCYLVLKHRNSIETWSGNTVVFVNNTLNYNFTTSSSQAYGNNMKQVGSSWCLFSGDVDNDGSIDVTDVVTIFNDMITFVSGYVVTDLTNDNFVDNTDLIYCYNNSINFVTKMVPP